MTQDSLVSYHLHNKIKKQFYLFKFGDKNIFILRDLMFNFEYGWCDMEWVKENLSARSVYFWLKTGLVTLTLRDIIPGNSKQLVRECVRKIIGFSRRESTN